MECHECTDFGDCMENAVCSVCYAQAKKKLEEMAKENEKLIERINDLELSEKC